MTPAAAADDTIGRAPPPPALRFSVCIVKRCNTYVCLCSGNVHLSAPDRCTNKRFAHPFENVQEHLADGEHRPRVELRL